MTSHGRGRRLFIDWARGFAVLCMIEHHSFDAWMPAAFHGSATDRFFRFMGGVAAPSFLFLAGLAVVLGLEGQLARGTSRTAAALGAAKRGALIFAGAYLFRFQEWAFAFGAAPATDLLRIDILNCIGVALLCVALAWALPRSLRGRAALFALLGAAVFFAAPLVWAAPLSGLPTVIADYLHGGPPRALFPLFPWTGYAFAGALLGLAFARARAAARPARAEALLMAALALGSVACWFAVLGLDRLPGKLYPELEWWKTSPAYSLLRCCSEVWLLCGFWAVEKLGARLWARLPAGPLLMLGRHSLLVYWVHIEIVYGRFTWPVRGKLTLPEASLALLLLLASQVALAYAVDPLKRRLAKLRLGFRLPASGFRWGQRSQTPTADAGNGVFAEAGSRKPEAELLAEAGSRKPEARG